MSSSFSPYRFHQSPQVERHRSAGIRPSSAERYLEVQQHGREPLGSAPGTVEVVVELVWSKWVVLNPCYIVFKTAIYFDTIYNCDGMKIRQTVGSVARESVGSAVEVAVEEASAEVAAVGRPMSSRSARCEHSSRPLRRFRSSLRDPFRSDRPWSDLNN